MCKYGIIIEELIKNSNQSRWFCGYHNHYIMSEAGEWVSAILTTIGLPDPIDHKSSSSESSQSSEKDNRSELEKWQDYEDDD